MKNNINFDRKTKKSFFGSKGMYVALALCLCGALGTTWYSVNKALDGIDENDPFVSQAGEENSKKEQPSPSQDTELTSQQTYSEDLSTSSEQESSSEPQQVSQEVSPTLYIMPVTGEIINDFSDHMVVKNITLDDWRTHDGIDIKADVTTPVKCVTDGVVKEIYKDELMGTVVVVEHSGNVESYYCNMNDLVNVSVGQEIEIGHVLGSVGSSAISESCLEDHLHFAVKVDGEWADPIEVLGVMKD